MTTQVFEDVKKEGRFYTATVKYYQGSKLISTMPATMEESDYKLYLLKQKLPEKFHKELDEVFQLKYNEGSWDGYQQGAAEYD